MLFYFYFILFRIFLENGMTIFILSMQVFKNTGKCILWRKGLSLSGSNEHFEHYTIVVTLKYHLVN